jgi:hypothetical protein
MKKYFYISRNRKYGPFNVEELKSENLDRDTLVWFQGIKDWVKASEVEELAEIFIHLPPPIPVRHNKIFRLSILILSIAMVLSCIVFWFRIDSIIVSGPFVGFLSLLTFILSKKENNSIRALSLLPLAFCVLCFLIIAIGELGKDQSLIPIGTLITVGTILFLVMTFERIRQ